jgi:transposase
LHRAGELVCIRIPTPCEEAVRDLCRARADLVDDRSRARRRLQAFLLRHGRVYRAGACWAGKHQRWLGTQHFDAPQLQATFAHYRAVAATRDAQVTAIEADLAEAATKPPFAGAVVRLAAYRGVGQLGALSLAAEVGDWRRFAHAAGFMAFTGLVPSERSSGDSVWRGHITRTGSKHLRFQLVESAWSYHHRPLIAGALRERQQHVGADTLARSWAAQLRLCRRFRQLERRKHIKGVAVVAVARELAGFLWADATWTAQDHDEWQASISSSGASYGARGTMVLAPGETSSWLVDDDELEAARGEIVPVFLIFRDADGTLWSRSPRGVLLRFDSPVLDDEQMLNLMTRTKGTRDATGHGKNPL